ncbi:hypothetical protein DFH08DRAFT_800132 [Mycena albidolilacea]|uniref:Uncharacterized protein n=1 Tax=Mycena albidolilacea TaxID=1033008 RepID=A0AAD7EZP8_9AGAR|nr:hypothetical protein DFH08DRAFT_800132 [Mycena albidolilacea]
MPFDTPIPSLTGNTFQHLVPQAIDKIWLPWSLSNVCKRRIQSSTYSAFTSASTSPMTRIRIITASSFSSRRSILSTGLSPHSLAWVAALPLSTSHTGRSHFKERVDIWDERTGVTLLRKNPAVMLLQQGRGTITSTSDTVARRRRAWSLELEPGADAVQKVTNSAAAGAEAGTGAGGEEEGEGERRMIPSDLDLERGRVQAQVLAPVPVRGCRQAGAWEGAGAPGERRMRRWVKTVDLADAVPKYAGILVLGRRAGCIWRRLGCLSSLLSWTNSLPSIYSHAGRLSRPPLQRRLSRSPAIVNPTPATRTCSVSRHSRTVATPSAARRLRVAGAVDTERVLWAAQRAGREEVNCGVEARREARRVTRRMWDRDEDGWRWVDGCP